MTNNVTKPSPNGYFSNGQLSPGYLSILFSLRLFFYLSVASLLLFHPGIVISYDYVGLVQWFLIIPVAALLAFLLPFVSPLFEEKISGIKQKAFAFKLIIVIFSIGVLSVWAAGFSFAAFTLFFAGIIAFILTLLLFHYPRWGKLSVLEPFFFAWVCFRLLVFSRAGEDIAGEAQSLTQFILVWTAVVFLFHSALVYFCLYPRSQGGALAEGAVFSLASLLALTLALVLLPPDFIRNTVIDNFLSDRMERRVRPSSHDWGLPDEGSGRRQGRRTLPRDSTGRDPALHGIPGFAWGTGEGGENQQFTVMVVASEFEPVYLANSIRGRLDPVEGFLAFPDEALNRLPAQRLFVSWFDSEPIFDRGRERQEVFALSMLSQRYFPYRPFTIDPTILSENSGPLRYIHRVVSNVHLEDPLALLNTPVRELNPMERARLAPYLELTLDEADLEVFRAHLERVLQLWEQHRGMFTTAERNDYNNYMERILAILTGFFDFQYYATMFNHYSIADLVDFILYTREGDCVEFSNTAAVLGRLAGIPSRVVTGFLAADSLQTMAHLRGLSALRSRIPILQEFPFSNLFLVTDAHGHSWTQFYIPDYGWLDFEPTGFAIPPPAGSGDANLRDVVIPILDGNQVFAPVRAFPWRPVLRALALLAVLAIVSAYALRYGREAALRINTRKGGHAGARSLYLLLLARLAADGKPIKPLSKTAPEYSQLFSGTKNAAVENPEAFTPFAALYTELRWRNYPDQAEMEERFEELKEEYRKILAENRRKGLAAFLIRVFSLRGLAYL